MSRRLSNLNPYELHKHLINEYVLTKPGATKHLQRDTSRDKRDHDVIKEHHRFLWEDETIDTWEKQLAKKYYDKLFKEYCIADLSRYKENKVAMRWRIEKEVVVGKGQFICGNRACEEGEALRSWEVNFAYIEQGSKKNALVKLRLCPKCSDKLNYHSKKREIKRLKKRARKQKIENGDMLSEADVTHEKHTNEAAEQQHADDIQSVSMDDDRSDLPCSSSMPTEGCWTKGPEIEDKSREEEFDEYLEDLLL